MTTPGTHTPVSTAETGDHFDFDVAVIGAGPSGSRGAQLLASLGHRVALFERDPEPGHPVHCTGIISRECVEQYELPSSIILHGANSFVLRSPRGHAARVRRKAIQAYIVDRIALDQLLAARAVEAGATLITNATVEDVRWTGGGVTLSVAVTGERRAYRARVAVLATGHGSPLSRKLGFLPHAEVISGCQAVVEAPNMPEVEVFTGQIVGHGGYGWIVPYKTGQALVGVLTRAHTVRYMHGLIQKLQDDGRIGPIVREFRCRGIPIGLAERTVVDGIVAVGDVANQVKPTSGGGIYYGMLGAESAAATVHEALAAGDTSAVGLGAYEARWRRTMEREIRTGQTLRHACEQLSDGTVERLHWLLRVPGLRRVLTATSPRFDWHSAPLLHVLDRFRRASHATGEPPTMQRARRVS